MIYSTGCVSRLDAIAAASAACVVTCESNVLFLYMYCMEEICCQAKVRISVRDIIIYG